MALPKALGHARFPRGAQLGPVPERGSPLGAGGRRQHLQGSTCGYLFLETLAGSSASTLGCSFPTSFSSCGTELVRQSKSELTDIGVREASLR